jgi:hypothetical protein
MVAPTPDKPPVVDYRTLGARPARPWYRTTRGAVVGGLAVLAAAAVIAIIQFLAIYLPLRERLDQAAAHARMLNAAVAGDPRFARVSFEAFTGGNGSILVRGDVADASDLAALRQLVSNSKPPVEVGWGLLHTSASPTRPATRPAMTPSP